MSIGLSLNYDYRYQDIINDLNKEMSSQIGKYARVEIDNENRLMVSYLENHRGVALTTCFMMDVEEITQPQIAFLNDCITELFKGIMNHGSAKAMDLLTLRYFGNYVYTEIRNTKVSIIRG